MIITIKDKDRRVEIETEAEQFAEVMEDVKALFIAWGFHPDTVKEYWSEIKPEEIHTDSTTDA